MEIKFETAKLDACAKQLYACEKILNSKIHELLEISEKLQRMSCTESSKVVRENLKMQIEEIQLQCRHLLDMQKVLRKTIKIYQKCEEDILQSNETPIRQFEEKPRIVHLEKLEGIQIVLK